MAKKAAATPPAFKPVAIPVKRGWLATDSNGWVWWYKQAPRFEKGSWFATTPIHDYHKISIGKKITHAASEASLVEIKKASKLELRLVTE